MKINFAEIRKAIVAGIAALALLANTIFLDGTVNHYLTVIIGFGTAVTVWWVKNEPAVTEIASAIPGGAGLLGDITGRPKG